MVSYPYSKIAVSKKWNQQELLLLATPRCPVSTLHDTFLPRVVALALLDRTVYINFSPYPFHGPLSLYSLRTNISKSRSNDMAEGSITLSASKSLLLFNADRRQTDALVGSALCPLY